jgi:excisionase family DNA binding protein
MENKNRIKQREPEDWLTKRELARQLKVSTRTIERLGLPAWRVGGQNRYLRSEVERFLSGQSHPGDVVELRR